MFLVPVCFIVKFKRDLLTFVAFPEIQDGGQKKPEGQMLILIFKVKATVLSLLSCIFVMLNSQRF